MRMRLPVLCLIACSTLWGGDREFDEVVKSIERNYNAHPMRIPFMGLANRFARIVHPEGVSGFRIAVFNDLPAASGDRLPMMERPGNMHPLVEVQARGDGDSTYIYTGEIGKSTKLLIATINRDQATVIEVKVAVELLVKALKNPTHLTETLGIDTHGGDDK